MALQVGRASTYLVQAKLLDPEVGFLRLNRRQFLADVGGEARQARAATELGAGGADAR